MIDENHNKNQKPTNEDLQDPWWRPALFLFFELSGWIAGPIIIAVFVGEWLDQRYGTEPWLYLASVGVAFTISTIGIVRGAMKAMKKIEEQEKAKNDSNS